MERKILKSDLIMGKEVYISAEGISFDIPAQTFSYEGSTYAPLSDVINELYGDTKVKNCVHRNFSDGLNFIEIYVDFIVSKALLDIIKEVLPSDYELSCINVYGDDDMLCLTYEPSV